MEIQIQRGCGLDVHQATVVACLLIVLADGKVKKQIRQLFRARSCRELTLGLLMLSSFAVHYRRSAAQVRGQTRKRINLRRSTG